MNLKRALLLGCIGALAMDGVTRAQSTESQTFNGLLTAIRQGEPLASSETVLKVEQSLIAATSTQERIRVKSVLAQSLYARGEKTLNDEDRERARDLWRSIARDDSNTWQGILARISLIADVGNQGRYDEQIVLAKDALVDIDFDAVDNSQDMALDAIRHAYGEKRFQLQDALRAMLVNAYCNRQRLDEAKQVHAVIANPEYASLMARRIELAERERREREARWKQINSEPGARAPNDTSSEVSPSVPSFP